MVRQQIQEKKPVFPMFSVEGCRDIIRLNGPDLEDALNHAYSGAQKENNVVICRSNKRANIYNREIRRRILYLEEEISTGDYLMVVKNNYFGSPLILLRVSLPTETLSN